MTNANTDLLTRMAEALGDLREQFVFVGGCATALLITDPGAPSVRATQDVDAVVGIVSPAEYYRLGKKLRTFGFAQTLNQGEPPYRWTIDGMKLDLMPVETKILGFSNRWYEPALLTFTTVQLREGLSIRLIDPVLFVATKLEAFEDRGKGDYLESHDLEDVLSVVDGRPELVEEIARANQDVRHYVAGVIDNLIADEDFINALPGLLLERTPATRLPIVIERLTKIAKAR
jgi:predicted nucleotidyltransferase